MTEQSINQSINQYYWFVGTRQHPRLPMTSGESTITTKVLGLLLTIDIDDEMITFLAKIRSEMVTRY